ncbi:MAG: penicillin-binding protein 1C [Anaerolineae bacterium]|nr:penicillin-binding protein 1C [Anaerolineae bacterium]
MLEQEEPGQPRPKKDAASGHWQPRFGLGLTPSEPSSSPLLKRLARARQRKAKTVSLTPIKVAEMPPSAKNVHPARTRRSWLHHFSWFFIGLIGLSALALIGGVAAYTWVAVQLPSADELRPRSLQFATTQILDREGNLLWEIIDPTGGRRTDVPLAQISPHLVQATLATEDRYFYLNVGVDPIAITRAVYDNLSEQQIVSGASTITQQLARNVFLTPAERTEQSFARKIKEAVLAVEINRRYSKDQILEIYFNQIYYGNLAYGCEAAAQTYFGKSAADLTLPEASLLAGLPQSPAIHDPYTNLAGAKARQADVLNLMVEAGYLTTAEAEAAQTAPLHFSEPNFALEAPHFVSYVRRELERIVPAATIYRAGLRVTTTLDPRLQAIAEQAVQAQVAALAERDVTDGALLALDVPTGQIVAYVGSPDFRDTSIDGQVDMVSSPRQPGSTIKPLTYLAAFETLGWTPSTLLMDVPVEYPDTEGNIYRPTNVDLQFHGPVSLRTALANSYNIPALKAMEQVGVERLKEMAARLGITSLTRDDYGLPLTLGSGEVSLLEMTGAYQALANQGRLIPPTAILKITDNFGREIEPARPQPRPVLRPEHAYLITDILADNVARTPSFGLNSDLRLSRPAAAKTGTTNDFRDNWTIGYTPDLVSGVWLGNADNRPMREVGGAVGAAPIWHTFMAQAHQGQPINNFVRPETIVTLTVCADSGTLPSEVCPETRSEIFFEEQPPLGPQYDMHQLVEIDFNSGLLVNEFCRSNIGKRYFRVFPPDGRDWALSQSIEQPPTKYCPSTNMIARITDPVDSSAVRGTIFLEGVAIASNFSHYQLELGTGTAPQSFIVIQNPVYELKDNQLLGTFDTRQLENGSYTLRLVVFDALGGFTESRTRVLVDNPPGFSAVPRPVTTPPVTPTPLVTTTLTLTQTLPITPASVQPITASTTLPGVPPVSPADPSAEGDAAQNIPPQPAP